MRILAGIVGLGIAMSLSVSAFAQVGGGGGLPNGTGDAAAQNLPSTVGVGRQTGNGYYTGVGGGERPYGYRSGIRSGRSAYRGRVDAYSNAYGPFDGYPRVRGYGYGFGRYPY